jgi:hypothetical protein
MARTVLIAAVLGGLAMFVWSAATHMSPLGMIGIQYFPREAIIVDTLSADLVGLTEGMYVFPAVGAEAGPERPSGMIVYHAFNMFTMMGLQIPLELLKEIVQAGLLAYLLMQVRGTAGRRIGLAALAGIMVALTTNGSYAVWYGMPLSYTAVAMGVEIIGYVIAGTVIALLLARVEAKASTRA